MDTAKPSLGRRGLCPASSPARLISEESENSGAGIYTICLPFFTEGLGFGISNKVISHSQYGYGSSQDTPELLRRVSKCFLRRRGTSKEKSELQKCQRFSTEAALGNEARIEEIFQGSYPFLWMKTLTAVIVILFPKLSTWLPSFM
jgi:hypothetical protein